MFIADYSSFKMIRLAVEMNNIKTNLTKAVRYLIILPGNTNETTIKYYFKRPHTHVQIYEKLL